MRYRQWPEVISQTSDLKAQVREGEDALTNARDGRAPPSGSLVGRGPLSCLPRPSPSEGGWSVVRGLVGGPRAALFFVRAANFELRAPAAKAARPTVCCRLTDYWLTA